MNNLPNAKIPPATAPAIGIIFSPNFALFFKNDFARTLGATLAAVFPAFDAPLAASNVVSAAVATFFATLSPGTLVIFGLADTFGASGITGALAEDTGASTFGLRSGASIGLSLASGAFGAVTFALGALPIIFLVLFARNPPVATAAVPARRPPLFNKLPPLLNKPPVFLSAPPIPFLAPPSIPPIPRAPAIPPITSPNISLINP